MISAVRPLPATTDATLVGERPKKGVTVAGRCARKHGIHLRVKNQCAAWRWPWVRLGQQNGVQEDAKKNQSRIDNARRMAVVVGRHASCTHIASGARRSGPGGELVRAEPEDNTRIMMRGPPKGSACAPFPLPCVVGEEGEEGGISPRSTS